MEHDDTLDLAELGRRLGHDLHRHSRLAASSTWPPAVLEGFLAAQARGGRRADTGRHTRKWLQLRLGALARGRAVADDVTPQALRTLDLANCPVLRQPLTHGCGQPTDWSVDRLNNDGAYALGNLAVVSVQANRAKAALGFDAVLQRAQAATATDGLPPAAWLRLAVLMLGPVFADRPLEAPDLPLCAPLPATSLRTATQQVQRLLTLAAGQAAERNRVIRQLAPGSALDPATRRLSLLADRLHHALKRLPAGADCWDAWLCPDVMASLHAWRASHDRAAWAQVARRVAALAGGRAVPARALLPWRLHSRGYLADCPPVSPSVLKPVQP